MYFSTILTAQLQYVLIQLCYEEKQNIQKYIS